MRFMAYEVNVQVNDKWYYIDEYRSVADAKQAIKTLKTLRPSYSFAIRPYLYEVA